MTMIRLRILTTPAINQWVNPFTPATGLEVDFTTGVSTPTFRFSPVDDLRVDYYQIRLRCFESPLEARMIYRTNKITSWTPGQPIEVTFLQSSDGQGTEEPLLPGVEYEVRVEAYDENGASSSPTWRASFRSEKRLYFKLPQGSVLYDDFSGNYIDRNKWRWCEFVREIDSDHQRLISKLGSPNPNVVGTYPYSDWNWLSFPGPNSVNSIQTDVMILENAATNSAQTRGRGTSRSIPTGDIVAEAKKIVAVGYKEIVLSGVNVGDYGRKIGTNLLDLLTRLVAIEDLFRIRISSVEPNLLTDQLLAFWVDNPKLCKHFHIPLQGGADEVLRGMRRRYSTEVYADRVHRIKRLIPTAGIGADVIVGFPGETESLFDSTYRFLVDLPISYLHVFTYSERPNTAALLLSGKVEPRIRSERSEMLRILSTRKRRAFQNAFIGDNMEALFEDKTRDGHWTGLTSEYVRVKVRENSELTNSFGRVNITSLEGECCIGVLVDTPSQKPQMNISSQKEVSLCA